MRWDFTVKPLKLPVQRGVEAFDGEIYRSVRGNKTPTIVEDENLVHSMRRRLWAVASILLTPLSELFVKLTTDADYSFSATNTKLDDAATIELHTDYKINRVRVNCLNPDSGKQQDYILNLSEELVTINELLLPAKITVSWEDAPAFEVEPIDADTNPQIPDAIFRIEDEG